MSDRPTFEGSYLGARDKISPRAIMECKICWTPYDPADGDDYRQIDPGTAFADLPTDWSCPGCSAPASQFIVREDPGAADIVDAARIATLARKLEADFTEIWHAKMRDVPLVNKALRAEAVGFLRHEGRPLGVLVSPWFMNLVQLPAEGEDWSGLVAGEKETIAFPSGSYEFIRNVREQTGGYKACSLFSPMGDFNTQAQATDVARAVMGALFDPANRAGTDRAADIRAAREEEVAASEAAESGAARDDAVAGAPTRRQVLTGGLSEPAPAEADDPAAPVAAE